MDKQYSNDDDVDLRQIYKFLNAFFKKLFRLILEILIFYRRRAIVILVLLVLGLVLGYFYDQSSGVYKRYYQEIILEPKYGSTQYLYEYIDNLKIKASNKEYDNSLGLDSIWMNNLHSITLEPVKILEDVIDQLYAKYEKQNFEVVVENFDNEEEESTYRNFYKFHKLIIELKGTTQTGTNIANGILNAINSNDYYLKYFNTIQDQARTDIEQSENSINFINQYLIKLNKTENENDNKVVVIADESKTITIASLLNQKEILLEKVKEMNEILNLHTAVLVKVSDTGIIKYKVELGKQAILLVPLILISVFSLISFLFYLYRQMIRFVRE
ncbi:hypothetical protein NBT05_05170 [Aquimarina sp. ERC-38]|uniref:hypothetical protein n=1 Tax=Aquimarina sp. ERC-38 TaxID=2949996 RepID=UPI00224540F4|nr:hypothetical protein [Aquimarina sp. ERC-38]UZO81856.1 hypothetical protein NBT05_05170 [Aquimarina sp. ERC-38]